MPTPEPLAPGLPREARRACLAAAMAFGAFVAYASLVPFRFRPMPLTRAAAALLASPVLSRGHVYFSRTDFLANVLLLVPFGCLVAAAAVGPRRRVVAALTLIPLAGVLGLGLAAAVELAQAFVPDRIASLHDVMAQGLGSTLGALLWVLFGPTMAGAFDRRLRGSDAAARPLGWALLYLAALTVCLLLPFDITLRPAELAEKYRIGRLGLWPFADAGPLAAALGGWAGDVILAAPLGALAWAVTAGPATPRGAPRERTGGRPARAALAALGVLLGLEAGQVLVYSRLADATDVVTGMLGALAGLLVTSRWPGSARLGLAAWILLFLAHHWAPYAWHPHDALDRLTLIPLGQYQEADPTVALIEAIRKALLAAPGGALYAGVAGRGHLPLGPAVLRLLLFFVGVELGQLAVDGRYIDPADVLLTSAAATLALKVTAHAHPLTRTPVRSRGGVPGQH